MWISTVNVGYGITYFIYCFVCGDSCWKLFSWCSHSSKARPQWLVLYCMRIIVGKLLDFCMFCYWNSFQPEMHRRSDRMECRLIFTKAHLRTWIISAWIHWTKNALTANYLMMIVQWLHNIIIVSKENSFHCKSATSIQSIHVIMYMYKCTECKCMSDKVKNTTYTCTCTVYI